MKIKAEMKDWLNANPIELSFSSNADLSKEQVELLSDGNIKAFKESVERVRQNAYNYIGWQNLEKRFARRFGYASFDHMPDYAKDIFSNEKTITAKSFIDKAIKRNPKREKEIL